MSVHVLSRFMRESESQSGARLVGIVMAHAAGDDGICWASQKRLMHETRLSERGVRDALSTLNKLREVETRQAQRGRSKVNVYRLWCADPPDYERLPFKVDAPFSPPAESAASHEPDDRQVATPPPADSDHDDRQVAASTPSLEHKENVRGEVHTARAMVVPTTVDRKPVTQAHSLKAIDVLRAWNELTGQSLRSTDWLSKIVMRIREYPEATVDDHRLIIQAALADPWWKGPPSPSVVYGSGAQFERSIQAVNAKARSEGRIEKIVQLVTERRSA